MLVLTRTLERSDSDQPAFREKLSRLMRTVGDLIMRRDCIVTHEG